MWWAIVKLQPPAWYEGMYEATFITQWTERGLERYEARSDDAELVLEPGIDYLLIEENLGSEDLAFPDLPELARFRHAWLLRRRSRPMVPMPIHTPLLDKRYPQNKTVDCAVFIYDRGH